VLDRLCLVKATHGEKDFHKAQLLLSPPSGQVWTYTSSQGWVQRGADISVTFANGDVFGYRAETGCNQQ
jgi:hypothetical protein